MQPYYLWPGAFGAVAQIAAYNESEEWLEELKEYLRGNAQFIADFIQKRMPKVKYRIPEATYLGWLDFRAYGMTDQELWDFMCHKAKWQQMMDLNLGLMGKQAAFSVLISHAREHSLKRL